MRRKNKRSKYFNIIFYLFVVAGITAQEPFMFHYSVKDGLPSKEVHSIIQDSKGYIWICTDGGIARYNANSFKVFSSAEGLPDNTVFEIMEDKKGRLWFRTFTGGIGFVANDSVHVIGANKKIREWQKSGLLQSFAIDEVGNLWIGRTGIDECFFIKVAPPFEEKNVEKIPGEIGKCGIDVRHFGSKLVFAEGRVNSLKDKTPYVIVIRNEGNEIVFKDTILSGQTIGFSRFFKDDKEVIFISGQFIRRYDVVKMKKNISKNTQSIITFLKDSNDIKVGFRANGVYEYTAGFDSAKANYLNGQSISAITKDKNGGYWFGTLEDGVYYCPDRDHYSISLYKEDKENFISSTLKINDSLVLLGTIRGQLIYAGLKDGRMNTVEFIRNPYNISTINSMFNIKNFQIVVTTADGFIQVLDLNTRTLTKKIWQNYKRIQPNYLTYYALSVSQLDELSPIDLRVVREMQFKDRLTSMAFSENGEKMFVGGLKGLYEVESMAETFSGKPVLELHVEDLAYQNGQLFIATKNAGILIKKGERLDSINVKNGIASNICRKLFLNGSEVWVLTSVGLSRIMYTDNKSYNIRNYSFKDQVFPEGIKEVSFFNNTLVYADKCNLHFFPLTQLNATSAFRISSISVNERKRNIATSLFNYDESDVEVNFEALFYQNNRRIDYRYKFKTDSLWNYTTGNKLRFPNLASGEYSLLLQVKDSNGDWMNCENNFSFTIKKPFWRTWQFILIEILLGVGILLLLARYRYIRVLEKEREHYRVNNKFHELEVRHLKSQMNPHFIFNSLNTLQRFILEEDTTNAHEYLTKFAALLRKMLESSTSETISLNEEIGIVRHYIEVEKIRFGNAFDYKVGVQVKNPEKVKVPFMLVQPFVENAIWHGLMPKKEERMLCVLFSDLDERRVVCEIDDNGVGREFKQKEKNLLKKKSLAIELISQRLDLLKKTTGVECSVSIIDKKDRSGYSMGTKVTIILPKLDLHA